MKKIIYLAVLAFVVSGCELATDNNEVMNLAQEELTAKSRYTVNGCYDEIVKYTFYDNTYRKIYYTDDDFKDVEKEINDKVNYIDSLNIELYQDGLILDCSVKYNKNDIITLYCINKEYKDKEGYYYIQRTLYPSKEEALEHRDEDCN
jgi:hypothetical protein